ncbi:biotin/lipoyl-containing protein, partial [Mycobacterium sp. DL440]|uniref:biotin/lipoyl-containing protein n=1 Tax=Mycobacterium sp. DL440 TaxID=2675523 RepID=UPI0027385654
MAISVQMPALGESVTEGTVTRWLKQEGDTVEVDEPLLEVSTDKVDTEIPSPAAGVLTKIVAQEDDTVEIGGELAVIGEAGEQASAAPASEPEAKPEPEPEPQATEPSAAPAETAAPEPAAPAQPVPSAPAAAASDSATSIVMPELGESVTEGTVTRWLKKVGDTVGVDEPLVEVSTDKVDTEIPSPVAGTLLSITAEEDDVVAVGGELAKIGDAAAAPAPAAPPAAPAPAPA